MSSGPPDSNEPYRVGPGKPPLEHRWEKGCPSPNPRGRPPKRAHDKLFQSLHPVAAMVISHDLETLPRRNGMTEEEITRGAAAIEALWKLGMKGNAKALIEYHKLQAAAYAALVEFRTSSLMGAIDYKEYWTPIFERKEARGQRPPATLPDPRDIMIDAEGNVEIVGPITREVDNAQLQLIHIRDGMFESLDCIVRDWESRPELVEKVIRSAKRRISKINRLLPPRRKRLWSEGNRGHCDSAA